MNRILHTVTTVALALTILLSLSVLCAYDSFFLGHFV